MQPPMGQAGDHSLPWQLGPVQEEQQGDNGLGHGRKKVARQAAGRASLQRLMESQDRVAIDPADAIEAFRRSLRLAPSGSGGAMPRSGAP